MPFNVSVNALAAHCVLNLSLYVCVCQRVSRALPGASSCRTRSGGVSSSWRRSASGRRRSGPSRKRRGDGGRRRGPGERRRRRLVPEETMTMMMSPVAELKSRTAHLMFCFSATCLVHWTPFIVFIDTILNEQLDQLV